MYGSCNILTEIIHAFHADGQLWRSRSCNAERHLLLWYLIRSPFFEVATRPAVGYALTWLRPIPLVSSIAEKACEILYGIQQYFTYTNAS